MRLHLIAILLLPLVLSAQTITADKSPQQAKQPTNDSQPDETPADQRANLEEGIKHVLLSQVEAWNHGKLEAFMQGYWHSPDLTFFSGATETRGWEPTLARYPSAIRRKARKWANLNFRS
jgi:hypothetical protein